MQPRITRLLDRRGLGDGDDDGSVPDTWADEAPALAGLAAASVQGTVALGLHRGARLRRLGDAPELVERPRLRAVTRGRTASICTQGSSCLRGNGSRSSACAAMPCGHRGWEIDCA